MSAIFKKLKAFNGFRMDQSQTIDSPPFDKFFNGSVDKLVSKLNEEIDDKKAHAEDPAASSWRRIGFAPLYDVLPFFEQVMIDERVELPEGEVPYFTELQENVVFGVVEIRERIVPGDVLRAEIDKECVSLEARQGEPVTRKQRMGIKDVIVARLLANALVKVKPVPVAFIPDEDQDDVINVLVFNSSRKVCEDVCSLLRSVFVSFPVRPLEYDYDIPLQDVLTRLVSRPEDAGLYRLMPGSSVKMVSAHQGEYTLKDESLQSNDHLDDLLNEGYSASRLMIRHYPRGIVDDCNVYSQFTLNSKGAFGGIKMSDVLVAENQTEDGDAWIDFMAITFMLFNELSEMLASLERYSKWLNDRNTKTAKIVKIEVVSKPDEEDENDQL
jgi:DNA recombination-dependent growth factor C